MSLLSDIRRAASTGLARLSFQDRTELIRRIEACRLSSGLFPGLDGEPDWYYTFFAELILQSKRAFPDKPDPVGPVDRLCAAILRRQYAPTVYLRISYPYNLFLLLLRLPWFPPMPIFPAGETAPRLAIATLAGNRKAGEKLRRLMRADGSFSVSFRADEYDLLSTAVARFALVRQMSLPAFDPESCRTPDGLYGARPGLSKGDIEYTFYALLALGV